MAGVSSGAQDLSGFLRMLFTSHLPPCLSPHGPKRAGTAPGNALVSTAEKWQRNRTSERPFHV